MSTDHVDYHQAAAESSRRTLRTRPPRPGRRIVRPVVLGPDRSTAAAQAHHPLGTGVLAGRPRACAPRCRQVQKASAAADRAYRGTQDA
jgi:hypothetical protein